MRAEAESMRLQCELSYGGTRRVILFDNCESRDDGDGDETQHVIVSGQQLKVTLDRNSYTKQRDQKSPSIE
jgi:hypothetical protein